MAIGSTGQLECAIHCASSMLLQQFVYGPDESDYSSGSSTSDGRIPKSAMRFNDSCGQGQNNVVAMLSAISVVQISPLR